MNSISLVIRQSCVTNTGPNNLVHNMIDILAYAKNYIKENITKTGSVGISLYSLVSYYTPAIPYDSARYPKC